MVPDTFHVFTCYQELVSQDYSHVQSYCEDRSHYKFNTKPLNDRREGVIFLGHISLAASQASILWDQIRTTLGNLCSNEDLVKT